MCGALCHVVKSSTHVRSRVPLRLATQVEPLQYLPPSYFCTPRVRWNILPHLNASWIDFPGIPPPPRSDSYTWSVRLLPTRVYASVFRVNLPPPWYGPPRPWPRAHRPTIRLCKAACLPYLPFIPALCQIPCKYHANQRCLQRLRLHQPPFTPIHTHHRSTGGGETMTMFGGGGATLEHIDQLQVWLVRG